MKLIEKINEVASNEKELKRYFWRINETVMHELTDYDALDKYVHMINQIKNDEELTEAARVETNFDFGDYETCTLIQKLSEQFTDFLIYNMEVQDFSNWIIDFDVVKFDVEK